MVERTELVAPALEALVSRSAGAGPLFGHACDGGQLLDQQVPDLSLSPNVETNWPSILSTTGELLALPPASNCKAIDLTPASQIYTTPLLESAMPVAGPVAA